MAEAKDQTVAAGKDITPSNNRYTDNKHGNNNAGQETDRVTAIGKANRVIAAIPIKTGVADNGRTAKPNKLKRGNQTTALITETKVSGLTDKIGGQDNISLKTTVKNVGKTRIN